MDVVKLKNTLNQYGQEHLLEHWDGLSEDEKQDLYQDLNSIDYEEMTSIFKRATTPGIIISSLMEMQVSNVILISRYQWFQR